MKTKKKPSYLLHKPSGQARVRINGKDIYLGEHGSVESRLRYEELVQEWLLNEQHGLDRCRMTIDELVLLYMEHAKRHYQKNGKPTSEVSCVTIAMRRLVEAHGTTLIGRFGPKALLDVRHSFIAGGYTRSSINSHIGRIRRMFKWATEQELVPVTTWQALCAVSGLREGRSAAKESEPVVPVPQSRIDAIRDEVSPQIWSMIQLQLLTGMRSGEVVQMRGADISQEGAIWEYRPRSHKTEHHRRKRVIFLGPQAREIVEGFLKDDPEVCLFSPAEVRAEFDHKRRENRTSPMTPSQAARRPKTRPQRTAKDKYTVNSYRRAIARGCERAFGMPSDLKNIPKGLPRAERKRLQREASEWRSKHCWHPHQLRHNAATEIRRQFGIEAARTVLGHSSAAVTEIYAEMDLDTARDVISKVG